ncbi:vWA domain-containing protein [Puniceicoccus vermicola]|uniref:VWA domain-containing protein n=1 Tax=Puniceicoccus vermicola TaxID=388746 RepID=A0A7X1AZL5_9BACT|nr:VWA domain-containing protein [Puniceicoccus vermicola]MBC2602834.1 VWA domain-containing protein [Puniceicoccus vermicola]
MSFLWPYAWIFSALAIPIVLFYLIRTLPKRRPVSTLLFWDQIQPQLRSSPLWRKLRRLFSLLLQLAFLFLLILLLARPLLPGQQREPQTVIYVVDTSASMSASHGDRTTLQKTQDLLENRIANLRASDEALIIAADQTPQVLQRWTPNRRLLLEGVRQLRASSGESNLDKALDLAGSLARQRDDARIVVLSDAVLPESSSTGDRPPYESLSIAPPASRNRGLVEFSARRSRLDPEIILVRARIVQSAGTSPSSEEAKLELKVNDRLTDVLPLTFDEDEPIEKTWRIPETSMARIEAKIVGPGPDSLFLDDSASVDIDPVETLSIRLVSAPNPFLEAILSSLELVDVARIRPDNVTEDPEVDLYLFNEVSPPTDFLPRAMVLIQPSGEGVWGERLPGESEESLVTDWQEENDLLRHVDLDQVVFPQFSRFSLPPSAEVLASSFDDPVLFGDWDSREKWLVTAFGLEQSDLVYRTVFPILVGNLVRSLALSSDLSRSDLPGETESRLQPFPERLAPKEALEDNAKPSGSFLSFPLRSWLIIIAVCWLILEWRLFHRRITE